MRSLLKILHGTGIGDMNFTIQVYYYVIVILRQFIRYYAQAKDIIIRDPNSLKRIISFVVPQNLRDTPPHVEKLIYQFLIQLVKEDMEKKATVGQIIFADVFQRRLSLIAN